MRTFAIMTLFFTHPTELSLPGECAWAAAIECQGETCRCVRSADQQYGRR